MSASKHTPHYLRIIHGSSFILETGCWEWSGNPRENGYCRSTFDNQNWYVHRKSYSVFIGEIAEGMDVCHKCDNRKCCNPEHLFLGTRADNMRDAVEKGRVRKGLELPQTKISDSDKKYIVQKILEGATYINLAKKFNVSTTTIGMVALSCGIRKRYNKQAGRICAE